MVESRRRGQGPAIRGLYAALIAICLFLSLPQHPASGRAQGSAQCNTQRSTQRNAPNTKANLICSLGDNLKRLLKTGKQKQHGWMDAADYVEQIRQFGVDFRVKTADELEIRRAGSYFDAPELNSLLDAVRANYRPTTDLSGSVEQVEVIDNPGGGAQVFIRFTVRSEGAPSIAQGYSLHVAHASLRSIDIKVPAEELDTEITLPPAGGREKIVIRPPDALARKTRNAVVRGYPVSGWLRFVLDAAPARIDADDLRQPALVFFVSFADAKGTRYEALRETQ